MERLHVDQAVTLSLDEVPEAIDCRVVDVRGPVSRLASREDLPPRAIGRLVHGAAGYLLFEEYRAPVGLRVAVRAKPPYLDAALMDGVAIPERRGDQRVKLVTRVRIIGPEGRDGERPPESTHTIDLSERGALLRDHPALDGQGPFALELMFGDNPRPIIVQAEVARRIENGVGVAFEFTSAADARRLGEYLTGIRHHRGLV